MQNSKIEWTDHTFNPWHGCQRVSPGCEHCYAEALNHRYGFDNWGPAKTTARREMSLNYWQQPYKWNEAARKEGRRARVFCASMADVFEEHPDLPPLRERLWFLIEHTPNLDWLLLTKRPENMYKMLPGTWLVLPRPNVWLGTSTENQEWFDRRIGPLLSTPARIHFLSAEPLIGPIDMRRYRPSWVIVGGESGHGARPMHPDWARSLRDQCQVAGVAFHFKQFGEYLPRSQMIPGVHCSEGEQIGQSDSSFLRLGKHAAGRLLDNREWNEVPL